MFTSATCFDLQVGYSQAHTNFKKFKKTDAVQEQLVVFQMLIE
jgi:hypothetical protein